MSIFFRKHRYPLNDPSTSIGAFVVEEAICGNDHHFFDIPVGLGLPPGSTPLEVSGADYQVNVVGWRHQSVAVKDVKWKKVTGPVWRFLCLCYF